MSDSVLVPVRRQFRALASTLLPETQALDEGAWRRAEAVIEAMLLDRPARVRRHVGRFIRAANLLPVLRYGRTFLRLPVPERARFLERLEHAPLLAVRRGVWGLRTLVCMGFYGQGIHGSDGSPTLPAPWSASGRPRSRARRIQDGVTQPRT